MNTLFKGMIAGFVATFVIAVLARMQLTLDPFTNVNAIRAQANLLHHYFDLPATMGTGWASHFFIGTILYGGLFGLFNAAIPCRTALGKAMIFMFAGWILSMLVLMPLAGAGLFGLKMSLLTPLVKLFMHFIFAIVLGYVYAHLFHRRITESLVGIGI